MIGKLIVETKSIHAMDCTLGIAAAGIHAPAQLQTPPGKSVITRIEST
ncbi:hypothetical protein ACOJBM_43345 [Rhizobium beringeri]